MKKVHGTLFKLNIFVIIAGSIFLLWFYFIDGKYLYPVITYREEFDAKNIQLTKKNYNRGEMVAYTASFCKNRKANVSMQWSLSNRYLTIYPEKDPVDIASGCFPSGDELIAIPIEMIPVDAELGCEHFFIGQAKVDIGGGRVNTIQLKTEKFCVN